MPSNIPLEDIARPAILKDGNEWKLYFDNGGVGGCELNIPAIFLATSTDLKNFVFQGQVMNRDVPGYAFAPDVSKFGNTIFMVNDAFNYGIFGSTSTDGKNFQDLGRLFGRSCDQEGKSVAENDQICLTANVYDSLYPTNPGIVREGNRLLGIWYGAHRGDISANTTIAAAYLQKEVRVTSGNNVIKKSYADGPDELVLQLPAQSITGKVQIYDSDGTTLLYESPTNMTLNKGEVYDLVLSQSCPLKSSGDTDCNNVFTLLDYQYWLEDFRVYLRENKYNARSDFDNDQKISIIDYNTWLSSFRNAQ